MTTTQAWQTVGGIVGVLGILAVLARISFQLGALVSQFRDYVRVNDKIVDKLDGRVTRLEQAPAGPGRSRR